MTKALVKRHLSDTVYTSKGHQNQERQSIQSAKPSRYEDTSIAVKAKLRQLKQSLPAKNSFKEVLENDVFQDYFPSSPIPNEKNKGGYSCHR